MCFDGEKYCIISKKWMQTVFCIHFLVISLMNYWAKVMVIFCGRNWVPPLVDGIQFQIPTRVPSF